MDSLGSKSALIIFSLSVCLGQYLYLTSVKHILDNINWFTGVCVSRAILGSCTEGIKICNFQGWCAYTHKCRRHTAHVPPCACAEEFLEILAQERFTLDIITKYLEIININPAFFKMGSLFFI